MNKQYNPTSKQWQYVTDVLGQASTKAVRDEQFDMDVSAVKGFRHECGTVHCVAGWYAVETCDLSGYVGYEDGAKQMANDLGFDNYRDLKYWAKENPDLWGNTKGLNMFAFKSAYDGAKNLSEVVKWFQKITDRVKELEQLEQIQTSIKNEQEKQIKVEQNIHARSKREVRVFDAEAARELSRKAAELKKKARYNELLDGILIHIEERANEDKRYANVIMNFFNADREYHSSIVQQVVEELERRKFTLSKSDDGRIKQISW